jgi:RNA polymerase sigma-70 factor (ECF subfamily)
VQDAGATFMQTLARAAPSRSVVASSDPQEEELQAGAAIVALHANAVRIWPTVALPVITYARHLATCVASSAADAPPLTILENLHTADLYLACAVGHGVSAAVELFVRQFLGPIAAAVQAIERDPVFVDEVRQAIQERLSIATDRPPRILQYAGRASLSSWVGVAAQRQALEMLRAEGARQRATARAGDEPFEIELDPELQYLKTRYRDAWKEAVTLAIAGLPQRQRTIMRLHTIGGLTLGRIGAMLQVDESTVSRWIQRAREEILDHAQRELGRRLGIQVAEVPSIARLVTSQLDISVARLLSEEAPR